MTAPAIITAPVRAARPVKEHSVMTAPAIIATPVPAARPVEEHSS